MKRILAFLMLLVLLAVCYGCGGTKIDPVLVPANNMLAENERLCGFVDAQHALIARNTTGRLIRNLETGNSAQIELGRITEKLYLAFLRGEPMMTDSKEYIFVKTAFGVMAINRTTFEHSFVDIDYYLNGATAWDELYEWNYARGEVRLLSTEGEQMARASYGEYGKIVSVNTLDDGFLILCRDEHPCWTDPEAPLIRAYEYTLVITDRKLNVRSSKMIGAFDYLNGCLDAGFQVSGSDDLLLCLGNNILLFDTKNGKHKVLVIEDDKPQFVAYENTEEMLERIREYGAYLSGVSADGKFALYSSERRQDSALYMIDLKSMKVTLQMTEQELRDIGINTDNHPLIGWHGGEYLEWEGWLYRLVDRSTLPAE